MKKSGGKSQEFIFAFFGSIKIYWFEPFESSRIESFSELSHNSFHPYQRVNA